MFKTSIFSSCLSIVYSHYNLLNHNTSHTPFQSILIIYTPFALNSTAKKQKRQATTALPANAAFFKFTLS
ncbi:hypothetical protein ELI_4329 [Eubacterium callanderi]|uniref:Uncharacterized protein n=1 Tax=Eubacterium callanderi TaxID=53442 RepID=E3GQH7_9FIRM|nr:hypothetical protein ELI_4329 [Eubacterium callanderi]